MENAKEIEFGDHFGELVIKANGARVVIHTNSAVDAFTNCAVVSHRIEIKDHATDPAEQKLPEIGERMDDGTIFVGISPSTGKPMYTTPRDEPMTVSFEDAAQRADFLNATNESGHHDWHVPTKSELNVLWENRDKGYLQGTFNKSVWDQSAGWYWSSSPYSSGMAWAQRFSDGTPDVSFKNFEASLRFVR